jgi:putative DNA primase/helicase
MEIVMKDKKVLALNPRVFVKGEGQDEWGHRYFKLAVKDSAIDLPPFSLDQISSDPKIVYSRLSNAGVNVLSAAAKNQLLNMLQGHEQQPSTFQVATRLGWNSGALVRPRVVIGTPTNPIERALGGLDQQMLAKYRVRGTLKDWQTKVAEVCTDNSRLILAISLAFTGPILRLVAGPRGGGFQFSGPPETGKTMAGMVGGSVWGCHRGAGNPEIGFAESWNSTAHQIEVTALAHNDSILILDETTLAGPDDRKRAEVVTAVVMALAQQNEKQRMTNVGPARWWRCYFLSTSNLTLNELALRGNVILNNAHRSRLTDIPLPTGGFGIYETLHGFSSGEKMTDALIARARKYCGSAGLEFQKRLVADCNTDEKTLRKWLARQRKFYSDELKAQATAQGMKPLNRSTDRCATAYAAGCLASKYGIVPWTEEQLLRAVLGCQLDGLRFDGTERSQADTSVAGLRKKVFAYLRDRRGKFVDLDKVKLLPDSHKVESVPGYKATFKQKNWLYVTAERLKKIIGKGGNAGQLKKELAKAGVMDSTTSGRYVVQRPLFAGLKGNKGYHHVHAFRTTKIDAEI